MYTLRFYIDTDVGNHNPRTHISLNSSSTRSAPWKPPLLDVRARQLTE